MPLRSVVPEKKGTSGNRKGNPGKDTFFRTALLMELKSKGPEYGELCTQAINEPQQRFEYWKRKLKERSP